MYLWMLPSSSMAAGDVVEPEALASLMEDLGGLHLLSFLAFLVRVSGLCSRARRAAATRARRLGHPIRGEAELGEEQLQRGRRPEGVHPDYGATVPDVAVPARASTPPRWRCGP